MAKRQSQVKQVWFTEQDEINFKKVAESLQSKGVDVEPDNRKAADPYSHTKVIRYLLQQEADELDYDDQLGVNQHE